jgi:hypothetical protein
MTPLLIAGLGLALIVGLVRPKSAASIIGSIILVLLTGPFIEAIIALLPMWVVLIALFLMLLRVVRSLVTTMLGKGAADHMIGALATEFVKLVCSIMLMPLKLLFHLLRGGTNKR